MSRRYLWIALACGSMLVWTDKVSAFGRRGGGNCLPCIPCYCNPSIPCWPCCPFCGFWARLGNPSGYVDPAQQLPIDVFITNCSCSWWVFQQGDYGFYVFDDQGNYVPHALRLPYLYRQIWVPPCMSILDNPKFIFLNMGKGGVQLGKTYTLVITLFGCQSWIRFTPIEDYGKKKKEEISAMRPASIVVTLPEDATLTFDDEATESTSSRRVFTTPDLVEGKEYSYTLKAEIRRDGRTRVITREVVVRAGEETQVELEFPSSAVAGR